MSKFRPVEWAVLVDLNLLIYREGIDPDDLIGAWGSMMGWQISQDSLEVLAKVFLLDFRRVSLDLGGTRYDPDLCIWRTPWERWSCQRIEGQVKGGRLDLVLFWEECSEELSYSGKFCVWWGEREKDDLEVYLERCSHSKEEP